MILDCSFQSSKQIYVYLKNCLFVFQGCWEYRPRGCVNGHNIRKIPGRTVQQCKDLCDSDSNCKAIEYGVAYGGSNTEYKPRDCYLQSGNNHAACDGTYWNIDLYIKGGTCQEGMSVFFANKQKGFWLLIQ